MAFPAAFKYAMAWEDGRLGVCRAKYAIIGGWAQEVGVALTDKEQLSLGSCSSIAERRCVQGKLGW